MNGTSEAHERTRQHFCLAAWDADREVEQNLTTRFRFDEKYALLSCLGSITLIKHYHFPDTVFASANEKINQLMNI